MTRLLFSPPVYRYSDSTDEVIGLIQGIEPDSRYEWYVAKALERIEMPYIFQYEIFDAGVRGGILIDFLVLTDPLATPMEVDGEHWHSGERGSEDIMRHVIIEQYFEGEAQPLLILYGKDVSTPELAESAVRRAILNA